MAAFTTFKPHMLLCVIDSTVKREKTKILNVTE